MPSAREPAEAEQVSGTDEELVARVVSGGLLGGYAGLELRQRRRPACCQDAAELVRPTGVLPSLAADAPAHAWHTYRRIEPTAQGARG